MKKFIFIITYDSYVRAMWPIIQFARGKDILCEFYLYDLGAGNAQIAKSRDKFDGFDEIKAITNIRDFLNEDVAQHADVIFFGMGGRPLKKLLKLFHKIHAKNQNRPMTISLSPGIRTPQQFDGFAARTLSDLIVFNTEADREEYQHYCDQIQAQPENAFALGMLSQTLYAVPQRSKQREIKTVYFIDQGTVPRTLDDKIHIAKKLSVYARNYPARDVIILMKNTAHAKTAHEAGHDYTDIFAEHRIFKPENLRVDTGQIDQVFEKADLCLSVSSAVTMECLFLNIPAAVINDFGFSRKMGNGHFKESGLAVSFDEIIGGDLPEVASNWRETFLRSADDHLEAFFKELEIFVVPQNIDDRWRALKYFEQLKLRTYKYPKRLYRALQMKLGI